MDIAAGKKTKKETSSMIQGGTMKYSMIRYNQILSGIEWIVIRSGKIVAEGIAASFEEAKPMAEKTLLEVIKAEKIETKVLMGHGDRRLDLIKTNK